MTDGHSGPVASRGENAARNCHRAGGCSGKTFDRYIPAARAGHGSVGAAVRSVSVDEAVDGDVAAVGRKLHAAADPQGSTARVDVADGDAVTEEIGAPAVGRDVAEAGTRGDAADSARGIRRRIVSPQTDVRAVDDDVATQVDVVAGLRGKGTSPIGEVQVCLQIDVVMRLKGHIPVPAQTGIYRADRNLR